MERKLSRIQVIKIYNLSSKIAENNKITHNETFEMLLQAIVRNSGLIFDNLGLPKNIFPNIQFSLEFQIDAYDEQLVDMAVDSIEKYLKSNRLTAPSEITTDKDIDDASDKIMEQYKK